MKNITIHASDTADVLSLLVSKQYLPRALAHDKDSEGQGQGNEACPM